MEGETLTRHTNNFAWIDMEQCLPVDLYQLDKNNHKSYSEHFIPCVFKRFLLPRFIIMYLVTVKIDLEGNFTYIYLNNLWRVKFTHIFMLIYSKSAL